MQLYSRIKLINNWSDPEPLNTLNEQGNVNYPYLMADGVTLYYASDGEGSLVDMTYLLLAMTQKVVATYDRIILECPLIHRPMTICMSLMN